MKLNPVVVRGTKAAHTQVQQDGRKRGILAINEEGKLVVCCRRTAKKNGWTVQEALYGNTEEASEPKKPAHRAVDKPAAKAKVKAAKEVVDNALEEILGK